MAVERDVQVSEAQIAVHWREEEFYYPPATFIAQANATDPAIFQRFSEEHFPECFKEYADLLTWDAYWHTTLDTSNPPFWKWFVGGRLNASYNCVDRHLATSRNKAVHAVVGDRKSTRLNSSHVRISYAVFCLKKKTTQRLESRVTNTKYIFTNGLSLWKKRRELVRFQFAKSAKICSTGKCTDFQQI